MKIIDLTQSIKEDMPVYPETQQPMIKEVHAISQDGFKETKLSFSTHTGTHLDCPAHVFQDGLTTETMQIDQFMGKAAVLDVSGLEYAEIGVEKVAPFIQEHEGLEFLILRTGWEKKWGQEGYFKDYPVFTQPAIDYLVHLGLKGIGLDTISLDTVEDYNLISHKKVLKNNCIIIENLCNLGEISDKEFTFCAFPLKFEKGDGSPVRAVAIL